MKILASSTRTDYITKITIAIALMFCLTIILISSCNEQPDQKLADTKKTYQIMARIDDTDTHSASKAKGSLSATYDPKNNKLDYILLFTDIKPGKIDIHKGLATANGHISLRVEKGGSKYNSPLSGSLTLSTAVAAALLKNKLHITLTSNSFPDGEISGRMIITQI